MGKDKTTTNANQQQTFQPTATQQRVDELDLALREGGQGQAVETQQNFGNLVNQLLLGRKLPGQLGGLFGGITPELTDELAQESVQDLLPSFQQSGILDSGVAASIAGRTAGDIRRGSAESNLGRQLNLLNLALGFGGQQQQATMGLSNALAGRQVGLAGKTITGSQTTLGMNPFMKSLQQTAGKTIGSGFGLGSVGGTEASGKFFFA